MEKTSMLNFNYSFGYDCQHLYNLCVCDENVIAWASGSIITFYNVIKKQRHFQKSTTGGSVGHITKNPTISPSHIAVGQGSSNGILPLIEIFQWPTMKVIMKLKEGTTRTYSNLTYSHDGNLLASLGGEPDFNLTIWNWKSGEIKLRTSAFSFSVYNVEFSSFVPEQLVTSGLNHIKIWKMATTFTGLKLKSINGRFGKTDVSDILGILPLPDEKVLSGCSWGNILIWEGGVIKAEIFRKGRQTCHQGPITQMLYCTKTDEIITISLDGHICTWYWNPEEITDIDEDNPFTEINPVTEKLIPNSQLVCIYHRQDNEWFAQDATGAIWIIKLESDSETKDVKEIEGDDAIKIINSHGGAVAGIACLRFVPILVSLGYDGSLLIHKLPSGPIIFIGKYPHRATCMYYISEKIDETGKTLVLGFENGSIRLILINIDVFHTTDELKECVIQLQILKPHTKAIKTITANENSNYLITSSEDYTIFVYQIIVNNHTLFLSPFYFIKVTNCVNSITWKPNHDNVILMACEECVILEAKLPKPINSNEIITYEEQFDSVCMTTLKNICLRKNFNEENEEIIKDDTKFYIELVEIDGNSTRSMLWAKYDPQDVSQIWTTQEGCNCILRLRPGETNINKYIYSNGNFDDSITSHLYIDDRYYFITGMNNGELSIFKMLDEYEDTSEVEFEQKLERLKQYPKRKKKHEQNIVLVPQIILKHIENIIIHDCQKGKITHIYMSHDKKFLYTAGDDGNIFSFQLDFNIPIEESIKEKIDDEIFCTDTFEFKFEDGDPILSHEEFVQEKERNALMCAIALHKDGIINQLNVLKLEIENLLEKNSVLPIRQQVQMQEHPKVQDNITHEIMRKMSFVRRRLAYTLEVSSLSLKKMIARNIEPLDIFPFQINSILDSNLHVKIIRQKKLPSDFFENFAYIQKKISKSKKELVTNEIEVLCEPEILDKPDEDITRRYSTNIYSTAIMQNLLTSSRPPHTLTKALRNYLQRLERKRFQEIQWEEHMKKKYMKNEVQYFESHGDIKLGEYYLKSKLETVSNISKYKILLDIFTTRKHIYDIQHNFNNSLISLRTQKSEIVKKFEIFSNKLNDIVSLLPSEYVSLLSFPPPSIDNDIEYPEKNLEIKYNLLKDTVMGSTSDLKVSDSQHDDDNDFDYEIKEDRRERHFSVLLTEQDNLLRDMKYIIEQWENGLKESRKSRERIILNAQFLKLHLLRLTQEKLILDSFECDEVKLSQSVLETQNELKIKNNQLTVLQKEVDNRKSIISSYITQKKDLIVQLRNIVDKSQYSAFLKRVFKKKSKLSESLSSKSSSSDEDGSSFEGDRDTVRIRLDSNMCPPGCDPQVFEETVQLRSVRFQLESDIREQEQLINIAVKAILDKNEEIDEMSLELEKRQNKLNELLKEKQQKLNDIDCVVILSADRCRFDALEDLRTGKGAIIFPATAIEALQQRVQQLISEAEEQRKLYNMSKEHLEHMKGDCSFMNQRIIDLKKRIQSVLEQKLGLSQKFSILNYESAKREASKILDNVLECMVNQFKLTSATGLTTDMVDQLNQWMKKQSELEKQYCCAIQEHISKLRTATVLQTQLFSNKEYKKSNIVLRDDLEQIYKKDLKRLRHVYKDKQKQIEDLRSELHRLKLKPYKSPILPPLNDSSQVSVVETPPPSELPPDFSNTRFIAMSLAKELNEISVKQFSNKVCEIELMKAMGEILPSLLEGKINVNQAADTIFEKLNPNKPDKSKNEQNERCKHSIAEILNQITKFNLGDDVTTNLEIDKLKEKAAKEFQYVIKGLLDAGVTSEDTGAIDIAVAALIDIAPYFGTHKIDIDSIVEIMQDETDCDIETIKDLVIAVTDCLSTQSPDPTEVSSIAAEFLKQLQSSLVNENNKKSNIEGQNFNSVDQKKRRIKKVSLKDVKNKKSFTQSSDESSGSSASSKT